LVCCDTYRAGAFDQLKQNATKAKIAYYGSYSESDPVKIAIDGVNTFKESDHEIIIVDTAGRHMQESALFEEMRAIEDAITPDNTIFVMDSSIGQSALDQAKAFSEAVKVGSVFMTKLDGHAKGGGALSAVAAAQAPISFIGTGEHIDNLEPFETASFVSRLLGMGDVEGLRKKFEEEKIGDNPELEERLRQGKVTLRDIQEQFQQVLKLGPMGNIMSMIPGLGNMVGQGGEDATQDKVQRSLTIMDSMTAEELDSDSDLKIFNDSRIRRILRGSGSQPQDIMNLFDLYRTFQQAAEKMKGMKLGKGQIPTNMADMDKLAEILPPHVLKQMGGKLGFRSIMKKLEGPGDSGGSKEEKEPGSGQKGKRKKKGRRKR